MTGDNGWFGLDWLNSIKDAFEGQMSELRSNESEAEDQKEDASLHPLPIGGFEKLRMFKCTL